MDILKATKRYTRKSLHFSSQTYRVMTNRMRVMPDFLIIGAERCGTSSLYYYLIEQPHIISASTKETHFFDENFGKGIGWYRAQFPVSVRKQYVTTVLKQDFLTGEGTPYYMLYPHAPKRTFEIVPEVKLIALLRNPVDRAFSKHWIETRAGFETWSFEDAIKGEHERLAGEREKMLADESYYSYSFRHFSYLTRGIYLDQLQNWLHYYPREQLLILRSEDMYSNPAEVLQKTLQFLGVKNASLNREFKNYRRPSKKGYRNQAFTPTLDPKMREYLVEYFRPHNARLYEYLGVNFDWDK
ncbi:MAG: sulfotransferase domain-containing protein [Chloroflexota bacterium]|nr:sulfotransferase domain-containing protein [Chloroflexota bacterium]